MTYACLAVLPLTLTTVSHILNTHTHTQQLTSTDHTYLPALHTPYTAVFLLQSYMQSSRAQIADVYIRD